MDEPWPLEVIGHDGKAHNVTMEPGDLVLYESHSVLHGKSFIESIVPLSLARNFVLTHSLLRSPVPVERAIYG